MVSIWYLGAWKCFGGKMSGKGTTGSIMGKSPALNANKDRDKKKSVSRSSQAGLQASRFENLNEEEMNERKEFKEAVTSLQEQLAAVQQQLAVVQQLSEAQIKRDILERDRHEAASEIAASSRRLENFSTFTLREIQDATKNFHPSLEIGVGGSGRVFRGILRNIPVAIKILRPPGLEGPIEACESLFLQEVSALSRVRHPNLVMLIGASREAWAIVYELLPNGSLEDRLACQNGTLPLSWQIRIRIILDICLALIFLHLNKPYGIIHGDLKPGNILLDSNFVGKIGDFGISEMIAKANSNSTLYVRATKAKGTVGYADPEFWGTLELTAKSDVYSFGVIILQILTGKPAFGIIKIVQEALDSGNLPVVLDESAGIWPFVEAEQLAHLGLRCCAMTGKSRPELFSVWRVLKPMRATSSTAASSSCLPPDEKAAHPHPSSPSFASFLK